MVEEEVVHRRFMARAFRLARRGAGWVSPNPMVGAVIVNRGRIVGEGYHRQRGMPHAEVLAIEDAGREVAGADLYANLEPCCHHGHTPPCTDAILDAGIRRVWVSVLDPNPLVAGRGVRLLRRHGVEVHLGLLAGEGGRLNEFYLTHAGTGRPFVVLKLAATLDGKIATATGESRWISGTASRKLGHRLRQEVDAILVGVGTVLADDPQLTVRMGVRRPRHPVRVILDTRLQTPLNARVLNDLPGVRTIVACGKDRDARRENRIRLLGAEIWPFAADSRGRVNARSVIRRLGREGLTSVLVEGGREVAASMLRDRIADKILMVLAPRILGGDAWNSVGDLGIRRISRSVTLSEVRSRRVGEDILVEGYLRREKS